MINKENNYVLMIYIIFFFMDQYDGWQPQHLFLYIVVNNTTPLVQKAIRSGKVMNVLGESELYAYLHYKSNIYSL